MFYKPVVKKKSSLAKDQLIDGPRCAPFHSNIQIHTGDGLILPELKNLLSVVGRTVEPITKEITILCLESDFPKNTKIPGS